MLNFLFISSIFRCFVRRYVFFILPRHLRAGSVVRKRIVVDVDDGVLITMRRRQASFGSKWRLRHSILFSVYILFAYLCNDSHTSVSHIYTLVVTQISFAALLYYVVNSKEPNNNKTMVLLFLNTSITSGLAIRST